MCTRRECGQAAVELVALLPCLVAVLAVLWQLVVAGHAAWAASTAARSAARAQAVGLDPRAAARAHLPPGLRGGLRVRAADGSDVSVSVRIPAVLGVVRLGRATASARFPSQAGGS